MKKILLTVLLSLGISLSVSAKEIFILEADEGSDVAEVLIKGNGGYCTALINSSGAVTKTDCIRLTNLKKIKILCTKKKEVCKTEKEVFDYLSVQFPYDF